MFHAGGNVDFLANGGIAVRNGHKAVGGILNIVKVAGGGQAAQLDFLLAGQQLGDDGGDDGAAALARAIGVEGAHNGNRQVKAAVKAFGQAVRADLGGRVGALALERVVLVNGHILGGAVYFAGGSNHHALGAQLAGGVQHVQGALDVGIHIAVRAVVAERNGDQGS